MKRYEKYKPTGIQWLPEIPGHWNIENFGKHFSFGKGLPITKADLTKEGIAVISYGQVHSKLNLGVTLSDSLIRYVSNRWLDTNPQNLLRKCDFVFADTSEDIAGAGNCAFNDYSKPLFAGYHIVIARPTMVENSRYWAYLFQSNCWKSQVQSLVNGVKVYSINKSILKKTAILIPSIAEQEKIVAYLDKRITLIENCKCQRERELQTLNELKQAEIASVVTRGLNPNVPMMDSGIFWQPLIPQNWSVTKLKHVLTKLDRPRGPEDELLVCSNSGEVKIRGDSKLGLVADSDEIYQGVRCGDLLIHGMDTWHGAIAVSNYNGMCTPVVHVCDSAQNKKYIALYLRNMANQKVFKLISNGVRQNTSDFRSWGKVGTILIPIPPIEEQNAIVEYIESKTNKIDTMVEALKAEIDRLTEYKQRLISDVVTGQIDVRCEQIQ